MATPDRLAESVLQLASWTYQAKGMSVMPAQLSNALPAVLVRTLNRVEVAIDRDFEGALLALKRGRGNAVGEVWVLSPLHSMGEAHSCLRGHVDRLVPWWIENSVIKFGSPRIP
jgi:hypothetical protein